MVAHDRRRRRRPTQRLHHTVRLVLLIAAAIGLYVLIAAAAAHGGAWAYQLDLQNDNSDDNNVFFDAGGGGGGVAAGAAAAGGGGGTLSVFDRDLVKKRVSAGEILREHAKYSKSGASVPGFNERSLVYVTPWNNHGYDVAKMFRGKFTHVSPVWYNIHPTEPGKPVYKLQGGHDVDKDWIADVRAPTANGKRAKVVPRFILQEFTRDDILPLATTPTHQKALADLIVGECVAQGFDGFVFELHVAGHAPDIVVQISKAARARSPALEFFLVVPPDNPRLEQNVFEHRHFEYLKDYVDRFSLMTYDYSDPNRPGPNSPIDWIQSNVLRLSPEMEDRSRLLVGTNMYGNLFVGDQGETVVASTYLDFLQRNENGIKFRWDKESEEHVIEFRTGEGARAELWYPTLKSVDQRLSLFEELGVGVSVWEIGQGLDYFYDLF
ncbi:glycoside hydrolase superfamily [Zopfochytrium polystomum]|nr:glycoside hydrolase superfamily [Zopfochytrium polystomum]